MSESITFTVLGRICEYECNDTGSREVLTFDGRLIADNSGQCGPFYGSAWRRPYDTLTGAAQRAALDKILRDYAESLLADAVLFPSRMS